MKKIRSLVVVLVVAVLCGMFSTAVAASDDSVQPRYSDFATIYAGVYETDSGFYSIEGGATAPNLHKWVEVKVTLEKYDSGKWSVVSNCTWTNEDYVSAHAGGLRDLLPGDYRAHTVAKVYRDEVLLETAEAYSSIMPVT